MLNQIKSVLKKVNPFSSASDHVPQSESKPAADVGLAESDSLPGLSLSHSSSKLISCTSTKKESMVQYSSVEEPVILTLSSDEDEDDDTYSGTAFKSSCVTNDGVGNSTRNHPPLLHCKEPDFIDENFDNRNFERRPKKLETYNDDSAKKPGTIYMQCRSIRIGSYKVTPTERVVITSGGFQMAIQPFANGEKEQVVLSIKITQIVKILASLDTTNSNRQVIFLYLTPCLSEEIRSKLKMFDKRFFYFDPRSNEQSHRRITLFPEKLKIPLVHQFKSILSYELRNMVKHTIVYDLFEDLKYEEANSILIKSSTSEGDIPTSTSTLETVTLFIYPPPPNKGGITITTADYQCLAEDTFLNDVLIDFHLKWLQLERLSSQDLERTHIMSSFFYKRLTAKPQKGRRPHPVENAAHLSAAEKRHDRVKSWTKSVDIFDKDFILVPINERSHWFLAAICFPGLNGPTRVCNGQLIPRAIETEATRKSTRVRRKCEMIPIDDDDDEYSDRDEAEGDENEFDDEVEEAEEPSSKKLKLSEDELAIKQPCILIFDSLSARSRSKIVQTLREYLAVEYFKKKHEMKEFSMRTMPGACPTVPQQTNFSDCGIFVMQYAECFFEKPILDFTLPIRTLSHWFGQDVMHRKRESLANLLKDLLSKHNPSRLGDIPSINFPPVREEKTELRPSVITSQKSGNLKNEAEEDSDSTTFLPMDGLLSATQDSLTRRKISINLSRRTSNVEPVPEPVVESVVNNASDSSSEKVSTTFLSKAASNESQSDLQVRGFNNCFDKQSSQSTRSVSQSDLQINYISEIVNHASSPKISSERQSSLQITPCSDILSHPSFQKALPSKEIVGSTRCNSGRLVNRFERPDYVKRLAEINSRKKSDSALDQITENYNYSDDDSDDEDIFLNARQEKDNAINDTDTLFAIALLKDHSTPLIKVSSDLSNVCDNSNKSKVEVVEIEELSNTESDSELMEVKADFNQSFQGSTNPTYLHKNFKRNVRN